MLRLFADNPCCEWEQRGTRFLSRVQRLFISEDVTVDHDRLAGLVDHLGQTIAGDVLARAMDELSDRLHQLERAWADGDADDVVRRARRLGGIAEQIGMGKLSKVARDVQTSGAAGDGAALAATVARLLRMGEGSMSVVCDLRNMSV